MASLLALPGLAPGRKLDGLTSALVKKLQDPDFRPAVLELLPALIRALLGDPGRRLPDLPSCSSIDSALRGLGNEASAGQRFLDGCAGSFTGESRARRLAYVKGRLLQRAGRHEEAAGEFSRLIEDGETSPEPRLRLVQCLASLGERPAAEELLRQAPRDVLQGSPDSWDLWLPVHLAVLGHAPGVLLNGLPAGCASPEDRRGDIRWLLDRLARGQPLRLDCGGEGDHQEGGWGRDRFFRGGKAERHAGMEVAGTCNAGIHRTEQWGMSAYRIPLPKACYRVVLHFTELHFREAGHRKFEVSLEGKRVLEDQDPSRRSGSPRRAGRCSRPGSRMGVWTWSSARRSTSRPSRRWRWPGWSIEVRPGGLPAGGPGKRLPECSRRLVDLPQRLREDARSCREGTGMPRTPRLHSVRLRDRPPARRLHRGGRSSADRLHRAGVRIGPRRLSHRHPRSRLRPPEERARPPGRVLPVRHPGPRSARPRRKEARPGPGRPGGLLPLDQRASPRRPLRRPVRHPLDGLPGRPRPGPLPVHPRLRRRLPPPDRRRPGGEQRRKTDPYEEFTGEANLAAGLPH